MAELELSIHPRFKARLRKLSAVEVKQLEANILADGVRDAIWYWPNGGKNYVVDGMSRLVIAERHQLPYPTKAIKFTCEADALEWIINNQQGRRNVTTEEELSRARAELYAERLAEREVAASATGTPTVGKEVGAQIEPAQTVGGDADGGRLSEKVASETGVSAATIKRDVARQKLYDKLAVSLRESITTGRLAISDAHLKILAGKDLQAQLDVAREARTSNKSLAWAMEKAGLIKPKKKATASPPKKKGPCQHSEDGQHEWESDGNGVRYCLHCKEDHPEDKKRRRAKAGDEFKKIDDLYGQLFRAIDNVASGRSSKKGRFHKSCQDAMDGLFKALEAWKAAPVEAT